MNTKLNAKRTRLHEKQRLQQELWFSGGHRMPGQRRQAFQCTAGQQHINEPVRHYADNQLFVRPNNVEVWKRAGNDLSGAPVAKTQNLGWTDYFTQLLLPAHIFKVDAFGGY